MNSERFPLRTVTASRISSCMKSEVAGSDRRLTTTRVSPHLLDTDFQRTPADARPEHDPGDDPTNHPPPGRAETPATAEVPPFLSLVELRGFEPLTPRLPVHETPSRVIPPYPARSRETLCPLGFRPVASQRVRSRVPWSPD